MAANEEKAKNTTNLTKRRLKEEIGWKKRKWRRNDIIRRMLSAWKMTRAEMKKAVWREMKMKKWNNRMNEWRNIWPIWLKKAELINDLIWRKWRRERAIWRNKPENLTMQAKRKRRRKRENEEENTKKCGREIS